MASQPPKDPDTEVAVESKDTTPHGAINLDQAMKYVQALEDTIEMMETNAKMEPAHNMVRDTLKEIKDIMMQLTPQISEATIDVVWKSIKDPICLTLRPVSEEIKRALEEMMPPEDIMPGKIIVEWAKEKGLLTKEQRHLLVDLFDNLEVVHEASTQTCSIMARLSRSLNSNQLKLVLCASIRLLVQLNTLGGLFDEPKSGPKQRKLPDDMTERIQLTMMADPALKLLAKEQPNSPT